MSLVSQGRWWRLETDAEYARRYSAQGIGRANPRIVAARIPLGRGFVRWHWSVKWLVWPSGELVRHVGEGWARTLGQAKAAADACAVTHGIIPFGQWVTGWPP